jgi:acyl-CoA oxidase
VGLGGFGIRFTVQFNLFAGSMVGLAGPEQLKMLDTIQEKGQLGCFLLTEKQAGVLSGLIVETTCDWDEEKQEFVLHTPRDAAAKNWISQGYTAEVRAVRVPDYSLALLTLLLRSLLYPSSAWSSRTCASRASRTGRTLSSST